MRNERHGNSGENGGTKEEYLKAKKAAETAVYFAERDA